jgi:hypothetical protein
MIMSFQFLNCERISSPHIRSDLYLTAVHVDVIEATLSLEVEKPIENAVYKLMRNDSIIHSAKFEGKVVNYRDSELRPSQTYTYQATLLKSCEMVSRSSPISITTMDTTSHDFQWEIFTFGGNFGSSALFDVAIISENNIWAVGEIYADSAEPWLPYNAVHWDGVEWTLKRIYFYLCPNGTSPTPYPINSVFAFLENDIWFARDGSFVRWNGSSFQHDCSMNTLLNGSILKIWGESSKNLYAVGINGTIIHYNDIIWQKLESGTDNYINDIWGIINPLQNSFALCPISDKYSLSEEKLILIDVNQDVTEIPLPNPEPYSHRHLHTVWFRDRYKIFLGGVGLFIGEINDTWIEVEQLRNYFFNRIRGTDVNNVFAVDDFGRIIHFNGCSWYEYPISMKALLFSLDVKQNIVVVTGYDSRRGYIIMGKREVN